MDVQTTGELIRWIVNGITILLMIAAASLAIKKNNNICLGVAIVGNLAVYYFTLSPLLCMIVSIACIIWASMSKSKSTNESDLKVSKSSSRAKNETEDKREKRIKCRFCKKLYSAEYNGCPYCKKV